MSILAHFTDWQSTSTVIKREVGTYNASTGRTSTTLSTIATVDSIFYVGSQSEQIWGEKIRPNVDGTCIVDVGTNIQEKDTLVINGKNYNVIYVDDVALQSEAYVVGVGEKN